MSAPEGRRGRLRLGPMMRGVVAAALGMASARAALASLGPPGRPEAARLLEDLLRGVGVCVVAALLAAALRGAAGAARRAGAGR